MDASFERILRILASTLKSPIALLGSQALYQRVQLTASSIFYFGTVVGRAHWFTWPSSKSVGLLFLVNDVITQIRKNLSRGSQ